MQIKDQDGKVIASIDLQDGFSVADLVKSLSSKKDKKSLNDLNKIEESSDKKQIVFVFSDGCIFYDLPTKTFVRQNGVKIGEVSFRNIKLNVKNKIVVEDNKHRDNFWLTLQEKTEVPWIKTFFGLVDIWANKKHQHYWQNERERKARNKIHVLMNDKKFYDCLESFSKIPNIQTLEKSGLISFYKNLCEITKNTKDLPRSEDAIYINPKKSVDKWFLENCGSEISENYFPNSTLIDHLGDYVKCHDKGMKDLFKYVFETYHGVITINQVEKIKKLIEFGYEPKRLMDYLYRDIFNQGLELSFEHRWREDNDALHLLFDYANMNQEMKREYEKYPRYLKTYHDITQKNYKIEEDKIIKDKFENRVKELKDNKFEYSNNEYSIILPKSGEDLVNEGQELSHCVASYYKRMASGETSIVFLRRNDNINQSLVTIEIKDNIIVQAKSKGNSNPKEKEAEFIKMYGDYLLKR